MDIKSQYNTNTQTKRINHNKIDKFQLEEFLYKLNDPLQREITFVADYPDGKESFHFSRWCIDEQFCEKFHQDIDVTRYNIKTKDFLIDSKEKNVIKYMLLYCASGFIEIPSANFLNALLVIKWFKCKLLEEQLIDKALKDDIYMQNNQFLRFICLKLTAHENHPIHQLHRINEIIQKLAIVNRKKFIIQNDEVKKAYKEMTPDLFEKIIKYFNQEIFQQQKGSEKLQNLYDFFAGYIKNTPEIQRDSEIYQNLSQVYLSQAENLYIPKYKNYINCLEYLDQISGVRIQIKIQQEVYKNEQEVQQRKLQEIQSYSQSFHFVRYTDCDKHQSFIVPECDHRVCVICFINYTQFKTGSIELEPDIVEKLNLRCVSRFIDPCLCDKSYTKDDLEKVKEYL